jgi:hypothetical protein
MEAIWKGQRVSHMSQTMKSTSTSSVAIPVINAKDSTFNVVGGNQTNITIIYKVDPDCDQGKVLDQSTVLPRLNSSFV